MGPDWIDPDLGPMVTQRGACDWLGLDRRQLMVVEQRGKLVRHMSEGKLSYRLDEVKSLLELIRAPAPPPTDALE